MNKSWDEKETVLIKKLYGNKQCKEIAIILHRSEAAVAQKAKSLGLKGKPYLTRRKYKIDDNYFSIPNLENSYWAGFLAADGCVSNKKKSLLRLKVSMIDKPHLDLLKSTIKYNGKIHYTINKKTNRKYASLEVFSRSINNDLLVNFNVCPLKTLTLQPPKQISPQNQLAFIKGYIDGDGCIHIEKLKRASNRIRLTIVGTYAILKWIKEHFDDICKPKGAKIKPITKVWSYSIASKKAITVLNDLQRIQTPILNRKWRKIYEI